jgi:hypothetical protein
MNLRRKSFLASAALCTLAFLFGTPGPVAAEAPGALIGTLFCKGKVTVDESGVAKSALEKGYPFHNCSVVRTYDKPAVLQLNRGGYVTINKESKVKICIHDGKPVDVEIVTGGASVRKLDGRTAEQWLGDASAWLKDQGIDENSVELPGYLSSLGFSSVFPSIGSNSGQRVVSVTLPSGQVVFTTVSN